MPLSIAPSGPMGEELGRGIEEMGLGSEIVFLHGNFGLK